MLYSIDSLENGHAVLIGEDETVLHLSADKLAGAREGDMVFAAPDGLYYPDAAATAQRKARMLELFHRIHPK